MRERLPWEIVETLPSTDQDLIEESQALVEANPLPDHQRVHALVQRALSSYWAAQMGLDGRTWEQVRSSRSEDIGEAESIAREIGDADTLAVALLGRLYALWGPDQEITGPLRELLSIRSSVTDEELGLRIREWEVIEHLLAGRLSQVDSAVEEFEQLTADTELVLFRRRSELWRANLAMLRGELDEAVRINQDAISSTAEVAGSPFSFQNVAVTLAIERFLRRGLEDLVEAVRSIRASSPRVGSNWDVGLAFTLSEAGHLEEAAALFDEFADAGFRHIPRDLNWAPTMHLVALVALNLDRRSAMQELYDQLQPLADQDTTHGSGYASYGPMGRVVGMLANGLGRTGEAVTCLDAVLERFEAGPWTALTRLERARARLGDDPTEALAGFLLAEEELRGHDMSSWADIARDGAVELRLGGHGAPIAVLRGDTWMLAHPSGRAEIPNGVGAAQIIELLRRPGNAVDVAELDGIVDESLPRTAGAEQILDATAKRSLIKRLRSIEESAGADADPELSREADFIRRELAASSYPAPESPELERARVRVTKAIRRAIASVAAQSPSLGRHLQDHVSTGRRCLYAPSDAMRWDVQRET